MRCLASSERALFFSFVCKGVCVGGWGFRMSADFSILEAEVEPLRKVVASKTESALTAVAFFLAFSASIRAMTSFRSKGFAKPNGATCDFSGAAVLDSSLSMVGSVDLSLAASIFETAEVTLIPISS